MEYRVSRSNKNFMRPYHDCVNYGAFLLWAEEEGNVFGRGERERQRSNEQDEQPVRITELKVVKQ